MRLRAIAALSGVVCLTAPVVANDIPVEVWKKVGDWEVEVRPGVCSAKTSWPDGTGMSLGFRPNSIVTDFVLSNPAWKSTGDKSGYDLVVQFGNQMPWRVPGVSTGSLDLRIEEKIDFFKEMMDEDSLVIRYAGKFVDEINLVDAQEAIFALKDCQRTWFGI